MSYPVVTRSTADTRLIMFTWPVADAEITATKAINDATDFTPAVGTVSFLQTEDEHHRYALSYAAADRPTSEGVVRYRLTDGEYVRYLNVRIASQVVTDVEDTTDTPDAATDSALRALIVNLTRLINSFARVQVTGVPNTQTLAIPNTATLPIGTGIVVSDRTNRYYSQRATIIGYAQDSEYLARTASGERFAVAAGGVKII